MSNDKNKKGKKGQGNESQVNPKPNIKEKLISTEDAYQLLNRYGYYIEPGTTPKEIEQAYLCEYQSMFGLPITGNLDKNTKIDLAKSRCGNPDRKLQVKFDANFNPYGTVWKKSTLTYSFQNFTGDLPQADQERLMRDAFDIWAELVPLTFTALQPNSQADILIRFATRDHGDRAPFDGPGNTAAHAFFPPPNAGDLAGDIHFDDDEVWAEGYRRGTTSFLTIAVHEIGHALGLGHVPDDDSVMNGRPRTIVPSQDDKLGIKTVYKEHIWIHSLYRDLLSRAPGSGELNNWVIGRFNGASELDISKAFCYSEEYSGYLAISLYAHLLDREPDQQGLDGWRIALRDGMKLQTAIGGFLTSPEYTGRYQDNREFVNSLYRRLLHRSPDPEGQNNWVTSLNSGVPRVEVVNGFTHSEEYCKNLVIHLYDKFLRRAPDEGYRTWIDGLKSGTAQQDIFAYLVSSDEFRHKCILWY